MANSLKDIISEKKNAGLEIINQKTRELIYILLIVCQQNLQGNINFNSDFKVDLDLSEKKEVINLFSYLQDSENPWGQLILNFKDLPQVKFWQKIFDSNDDFIYLNSKKDRVVLDSIDKITYLELKKNKANFKNYKQEKAKSLGVREDDLYFTPGHEKHYNFGLVQEKIKLASQIFIDQGVDPIYAEIILLIESPNGVESDVGAAGNFQLMPAIARKYGLVVNEEIDERKSFEKAAKCAANFIKDQELIIERTLEYLELGVLDEAYFNLLVLNSYQTGEKNIYAILKFIKEKYNFHNFDQEFLEKLWIERFGGQYEYPLKIINDAYGDSTISLEGTYGNQSSNYTQIAIAALIQNRLDQLEEVMPKAKVDSIPKVVLKRIDSFREPNQKKDQKTTKHDQNNANAYLSDETRRVIRVLNRGHNYYDKKKKNFRGRSA